MLRHIHIRDFAIVDAVDVEFESGMTALTGETGAGKSILLDALGLCLGDRADTTALPEHADRAEINASFEIGHNEAALEWLREQALDSEDDCVLRRVVQRSGRSQSWINGRPVPLQALSDLGDHLVDVHGQHAHQSLMRADAQRDTLDAFGGHAERLGRVRELAGEWRRIRDDIRRIEGADENHADRIELLRFQVDELEALNMTREDIESLDAEQRRLASAGDLIEACQAAVTTLYDDEQSVQSMLSGVMRRLENHADVDEAIGSAHELLASALVQVEEGCNGIRRFADDLEVDPARLEWVEERIGHLTNLARKHRCQPEELPEKLAELAAELETLDQGTERLEALRVELAQVEATYREAARELGEARQTAAKTLSEEVSELIHELGMPGGELAIAVEHADDARPTVHGSDSIAFQVRTNPDQRFGPLNKVASGGELSRIGLAISVATAHVTRIPSLIFDEADTGIGGAVAEVVGRKLRALGAHHQVLCVTHLPQVAAQAHHQLKVEKATTNGRTRTDIRALDTTERPEELARMLGGVEITENTLNHAREMLERAAG